MRKRDEGYVLPYVMVIMLVLAIVASSIMAISLKSLKAQQSSIQRMQDQYTAAGEIEKVVALLSQEKDSFTAMEENILVGTGVSLGDRGTPDDDTDDITIATDAITFTLVAEHETVRIEAEIKVTGESISNNVVTKPAFTYSSYQITATAGGADDET